MKKKSKKPASEELVNSIFADLRKEVEEASDSSSMDDPRTTPSMIGQVLFDKKSGLVDEDARELPEGLDSKTAILGPAKKKPAKRDEGATVVVSEEPSKTLPVPVDTSSEFSATRRIGEEDSITFKSASYTDRTQPMARTGVAPAPEATKTSHGIARPLTKSSASLAASVTEAQMMQAENLRIAQARLLELEKEVEKLRQENELLSSAGDIVKKRAEELFEKVREIEHSKIDALEQARMEVNIYRENLSEKDRQLAKSRQKIEELETRLAKDLKKIRVRERELENRLELSKMEKTALVRAKDDALLDMKSKLDQLHQELETYKLRCSELNQKVDGQHEQLGRTVRALRLALTHLEANDTSGTVTPLKKAE